MPTQEPRWWGSYEVKVMKRSMSRELRRQRVAEVESCGGRNREIMFKIRRPQPLLMGSD